MALVKNIQKRISVKQSWFPTCVPFIFNQNACCGVENYTDYLNNPKISEQPWKDNYSAILDHETAQIPLSCCMQRVQYKVATSTDDFIDPYYCLMNPPSYVNSHVSLVHTVVIFLWLQRTYMTSGLFRIPQNGPSHFSPFSISKMEASHVSQPP